jgi:hypothetical protein
MLLYKAEYARVKGKERGNASFIRSSKTICHTRFIAARMGCLAGFIQEPKLKNKAAAGSGLFPLLEAESAWRLDCELPGRHKYVR